MNKKPLVKKYKYLVKESKIITQQNRNLILYK